MTERETDRERGYEAYWTRDYSEAFRLLLPFADEDDADTQCAIASMYQLGLGVELDAKEAVRRYRRAADRGSALACNNLWCIYTAGWYAVEEDQEEARKWYDEAKRRGFPHVPREFY